MGSGASKTNNEYPLQRLSYDLSYVIKRKVPIIWIQGVRSSGSTVLSEMLSDYFGFHVINIVKIIQEECENDMDRVKIMKECAANKQPIPDFLVMDLLKEALLKAKPRTNGFIFVKFPINLNQVNMFFKEIGSVDLILFLNPEITTVIEKLRSESPSTPINILKKETLKMQKNLEKVFKKCSSKVERVDMNDEMANTFYKLQRTLTTKFKSVDFITNAILSRESSQTLPKD